MIRLGSLFAGIGGFDLGARWAFDKAGIAHKVVFQVEQNKYCQSILRKHWPDARIFDDVRAVGRHNLPNVDILMGGFPCQDISVAGHQKGIINGKKSSLWFEMLRIISEIRPAIAVLENVPTIVRVGGPAVVGGLASIGYDCEWQIISAAQLGAPHLRRRWFCVATNTDGHGKPVSAVNAEAYRLSNTSGYERRGWSKFPTQPPVCGRNDGVSDRVARLKALGNAIVPQCAEYIFDHIIERLIV